MVYLRGAFCHRSGPLANPGRDYERFPDLSCLHHALLCLEPGLFLLC